MARTLWRAATAELPALWLSTELSQKTAVQLIALSQSDELVKDQTQDAVRFISSAVIQKWLVGRELMVLESDQGDLLGIIWLSQKTAPMVPAEYQLTFGIRLYEAVRGKGLATPFLKKAFTQFKNTTLWKKNPDAKVWLVTKATNHAAIKTYSALGFTVYAQNDASQELFMLQTAEL